MVKITTEANLGIKERALKSRSKKNLSKSSSNLTIDSDKAHVSAHNGTDGRINSELLYLNFN